MNDKISSRIILGDCLVELPKLLENSVSLVLTDPPYNYEVAGKNWDDAEIERRLAKIKNSKTIVKHIPYGNGLSGGVRNQNWYKRNADNNAAYMDWCKKWMAELYRVCKNGAFVGVFANNRSAAHVQIALEHVGFYTRDLIIYKKNGGIPRGINLGKKHKDMAGWHSCLRNCYEVVVLVQKPLLNNYFNTFNINNLGVIKTISDKGFQGNIFDDITLDKEKVEHLTPKPLSLMEKLVDMLLPQSDKHIVLDCFAGSGTTLLAAKNLGFQYIGIEKSEKNIQLIHERLRK